MTIRTILLSEQAADTFGERIRNVLQGMSVRLVTSTTEDPTHLQNVELAFLSRDVTADSGRTTLAPSLLHFYAALRAAPNLRWLQTHTAGTDRPIYAELAQRYVVVTTSSGTAAIAVAQMALTGLLALARGLPMLMAAQQRRAWEPLHASRTPRDIAGQHVVIVGLGPIGQEVARLCDALGMTVWGVSRCVRQAQPHIRQTCTYAQIDAVLPQADMLVLACPLAPSTKGLLDRRRLRLLPRGAKVINVARGEVLVEADLIDALRDGHLGGAFLDVFAREPLESDSPLWDLPNVIISPHTAAHTTGHYEAVGQLFLENLRRWCAGEPLRNIAAVSGC